MVAAGFFFFSFFLSPPPPPEVSEACLGWRNRIESPRAATRLAPPKILFPLSFRFPFFSTWILGTHVIQSNQEAVFHSPCSFQNSPWDPGLPLAGQRPRELPRGVRGPPPSREGSWANWSWGREVPSRSPSPADLPGHNSV